MVFFENILFSSPPLLAQIEIFEETVSNNLVLDQSFSESLKTCFSSPFATSIR